MKEPKVQGDKDEPKSIWDGSNIDEALGPSPPVQEIETPAEDTAEGE